MKKYLLLLAISCSFVSVKSQNLLLNSDLNAGATNWTDGGCAPETGTEDLYGGPSNTNNISEVDFLTCMKQTVSITSNTGYMVAFQATRRTNCGYGGPGDLGINPGINVSIIGVTTATVYSSVDYHYNNEFWVGYTTQNQFVTIPNGATDAAVRVEITAIDNPEGCGVLVDNVTMVSFGTLPINLTGFNAAAKGTSVDLSWTTNAEINSAYFIAYRSKDGLSFEEVGKVNAAGVASTYTLNDAQASYGVNYYKLKMVDKNGLYKFSTVVRVNLSIKDLDLRVYPTVVSDVLNYVIENPKATKLSVVVTDLSGKRINSSVQSFANGTTQKTINVAPLASGVYFLTIVDETNGFKKSVLFKKN